VANPDTAARLAMKKRSEETQTLRAGCNNLPGNLPGAAAPAFEELARP